MNPIMNSNTSGILVVKPRAAELTYKSHRIVKMDPYCQVCVGVSCHETDIAKKKGQTPNWEDVLTFGVTKNDLYVIIKIFDKNRLRADDFLGEAEIPLDFVRQNLTSDAWYRLTRGAKDIGKILVVLEFTSSQLAN